MIPQTIEASAPPTVISSVSLAGLESVLSSSSIRFCNYRTRRFENSSPSTEQPIVKPSRKRSTDDFDQLDVYDNDGTQNAIFDNDHSSQLKAPKSVRIERVVSCSDDSSHSSSTSYRSSRCYAPDHLMERYLKLLESARLESKMKPPQMPQRKASMARRNSSAMPLLMPVRKVSMHNIANFTSSTSRRRSL